MPVEELPASRCPLAPDIQNYEQVMNPSTDGNDVASEKNDSESSHNIDEFIEMLESQNTWDVNSFSPFDNNSRDMSEENDPLFFDECMHNETAEDNLDRDESTEKVDNNVNYPYVPMSVEEVSVVTSLEYWTNTKVRVCGRFLVLDLARYFLCGVGKDKDQNIRLNLNNLDQYPKHGEVLEIFGELIVDQYASSINSKEKVATEIVLKVMFCSTVTNIHLYTKALSMVKPYIPSFVKREQ